MNTKEDWEAWHEERKAFLKRKPEGITQDLAALEAHIKKLTQVCPKDKAGWPENTALLALDRLTADYARFKNYLTFWSP